MFRWCTSAQSRVSRLSDQYSMNTNSTSQAAVGDLFQDLTGVRSTLADRLRELFHSWIAKLECSIMPISNRSVGANH
jgi:hypothetical protein